MTHPSLDPLTRWLAAAWLATWLAVAGVTALVGPRWLSLYLERGVELPQLTRVVLSITNALSSGVGLVPLALLLALGLSPLELAAPAPATARRWLGLGIVHAGVSGAVGWCAFVLPTLIITRSLGQPTLDERKAQLMGVVGVAWVALTLVQALVWLAMMATALRLPREALRRELARSAMIAALPAGVLAVIAASVVEELRVKAPAGILAPARVAAGGTAALLVLVAAVGWRLRAAEAAP